MVMFPHEGQPAPSPWEHAARLADDSVSHPPLRLQIRTPEGRRMVRKLGSRALVVGRSEHADLTLSHPTVSREHVRLERDADGQCRIHDMGSRNGVHLDGQKVDTAVLAPGQELAVGAFRLSIAPPQPSTSDASTSAQAESQDQAPPAGRRRPLTRAIESDDDATTALHTMGQLPTPKIGADQLCTVMDFGSQLFDAPLLEGRLAMLCDAAVTATFRGWHALLLRIPRTMDKPADVLVDRQSPLCPPDVEPYLSRTVLRAMVEADQPVVATNTSAGAGDIRMTMSPDMHAMGVIACPILLQPDDSLPANDATANDNDVAVFYVILPPDHATGEWLSLVHLLVKQFQETDHAIRAQARARATEQQQRDLERAAAIQASLRPDDVHIPGLDIQLSARICSDVGGDYVDALALPDGRALLVIGDVCGKGLDAAMIASGVHTAVHTAAAAGNSLDALTTCLNFHLLRTLPAGRFVTLLLVAVDPESGQLEIANAGHIPPLCLTGHGQTRQLAPAEGLPLGVATDKHQVSRDTLAPGETLCLYTDGLAKLPDPQGQPLGHEQLRAQFAHQLADVQVSLHDAVNAIRQMLDNFAHSDADHDDMTFMLIRRQA